MNLGVSVHMGTFGVLWASRGDYTVYTHNRLNKQLLEASFIHPTVRPFLRELFFSSSPNESLFGPISPFLAIFDPDCAPYSAPCPIPHMNINCELGEESAKKRTS